MKPQQYILFLLAFSPLAVAEKLLRFSFLNLSSFQIGCIHQYSGTPKGFGGAQHYKYQGLHCLPWATVL